MDALTSIELRGTIRNQPGNQPEFSVRGTSAKAARAGLMLGDCLFSRWSRFHDGMEQIEDSFVYDMGGIGYSNDQRQCIHHPSQGIHTTMHNNQNLQLCLGSATFSFCVHFVQHLSELLCCLWPLELQSVL